MKKGILVDTRQDIDELRPKKSKPFNVRRFLKMAKELKEAVRAEEEQYGPLRDTHVAY